MDLIECIEMCNGLSELYPHATFTEKTPAAYLLLLSEYPYEAVKAIMPDVLAEHPTYCPGAPVLLAKLKATLHPAINMQEAWERVNQAMHRCGVANQVCAEREINDPIIWRAAKTIGWYRIGTTDYKDHGTLFAQFKGALSDALENEATEQRREKIETALPGGLEPAHQVGGGSWKRLGA